MTTLYRYKDSPAGAAICARIKYVLSRDRCLQYCYGHNIWRPL